MMFAPEARLGDGQFDVVFFQHKSALTTLAMSRSIYIGTHVNSPLVTVRRGSSIKAEILTDAAAYLDIDGEAPGILPAEFHMHHHAIRLLDVRPEVV